MCGVRAYLAQGCNLSSPVHVPVLERVREPRGARYQRVGLHGRERSGREDVQHGDGQDGAHDGVRDVGERVQSLPCDATDLVVACRGRKE